MNLYPLNTFKGETKKELEKMVSKIIDKTKKETREETIREIEEELYCGGQLIIKEGEIIKQEHFYNKLKK